jgi:ATP-binding cassette subfamily B protein
MKKIPIKKRIGYYTFKFWYHEVSKFKFGFIVSILTSSLGFLCGNFVSYIFISNIINRAVVDVNYKTDSVLILYGFDIAMYILTIVLSELVFWRINAKVVWDQQSKISSELYRKCYENILFEDMAFFRKHHTDELMSNIEDFVDSFIVIDKIIRGEIIPIVASFIFVSIVLDHELPYYTIILVISSVLFILAALFTSRRIAKASPLRNNPENKRIELMAEAFDNIETVKTHSGVYSEVKKLVFLNKKMASNDKVFYKNYFHRDYAFATVITIMSALLIILISSAHKWFGVSIGTLVLASAFTTVITQQLWDITFISKDMHNALKDSAPMTKILIESNRVKTFIDKPQLKVTEGKVEYRNVGFKYQDSLNKERNQVFENFNLTLDAKKSYAIVGHTGAGKSTLVRMLLRFQTQYSGKILIDNQDISKIKQYSLHAQVGYISQSNQMFSDTIRANLSYGQTGLTDINIMKAVKLVGMLDYINSLPKGLDTRVESLNISKGQIQCLAIAREILRDTKILVLDSAFSEMDSDHEKRINFFITKLQNPITIIMITNKLSLAKNFDSVVVLEKGEVSQIGTHEELINCNGIYKRMWFNQQ